MSARQLRVELRRSVALPATVAAVALLVLLLRVRSDEWDSGLTGLALTLRNDLPVLLPVALGAGAWQGGRERRAATEELTATTSRRRSVRVLTPSAAVVLALVAGLAATLAAAAVLVGRGQWLGQAWPAAVVAVSLLAVAAAVLLGTGLGRAVRSDLVAPLLVVVLFIALLAFSPTGQGGSWPRLLAIAVEPPSDDVRQARPAAAGGQALWLVGLLLTGALLAGAARVRSRLLAAVPAVVGLALAAPLLSAGGGTAYAVDPVAARLVCADGEPQVCLTTVHADQLPAATTAARQVLVALRQLPEPPVRAVEQARLLPPDPPPGEDVLEIDLPQSSVGGGTASAGELAVAFAEGLGVRPCFPRTASGGIGHEYSARLVAGAWLLGATTTGGDEQADAALQRLLALPRPEQVARLTDVRRALRSCDRDALELLG